MASPILFSLGAWGLSGGIRAQAGWAFWHTLNVQGVFVSYELKPMALGEVLDVSLQVFKEHWKPILGLQFLFALPNVLQAMVTPSTFDPNNLDILPLVGGGVVLILWLLLFPIAYGGVIRVVANAYRGRSTDMGEALKFAATRYWPLVGTLTLMGIGIFLGFLFLIIPGIYFALACTFVYQVVLMENLSGMAAIKRSNGLMEGNFGAVFLVQLMMGVLSFFAAFIAAFPMSFLGVDSIGEVLGNLAAIPVAGYFATVYVVMYFSQRCRFEGYDLQMAISEVEQRQSGGR